MAILARLRRHSFALAGTLLLLEPARAFADDASRYTVTVPQLPKPPRMTGTVDDSWSSAARVSASFDFTYLRVGDPTAVYIAQDPAGLDIAFVATQSKPVVATQMTNGSGVFQDDNVQVALYPQGSQGFSYLFAANALGTRYQTSSENSAYSPMWLATASRTPNGYVVTMHIPFAVIRSGGSHVWRAQFARSIVATNSVETWAYVPGQTAAFSVAHAGSLREIQPSPGTAKAPFPKPRVQLYALGDLTMPANGGDTSRVGLDASVPVTATSSLVATLHPDYSNVEVDQQTIAPSAFPRQFAEVRPFFTQVTPNFNNTFACQNCPQTLYTPAIPTFRDGFAYEGTQGPLSFSAFDTNARGRTDNAQTLTYLKQDTREIAQLSAQRVSLNVSGFQNTATTVAGGYENQHSHVLTYVNAGEVSGTGITPNLAQYLEYGIGYQSKDTTAILDLQRIGEQFFPADGFVNQVDIHGYSFFGGKTLTFSSTAPLHDIVLNAYDYVYRDHLDRLAQIQQGGQVNFDLRSLLSLHLFGGYHGYRTVDGELLPFANSGAALGYKLQTSTPQSVTYSGGPFYHGNLTAWSYISTIPAARGVTVSLEGDENLYVPKVAAEPVARQWLERIALDWQFSKGASVDVGLRRIIGRNLPNAFNSPDLPTAGAPLGTINGFAPFDYVNAGNVSFALHVLHRRNEFYLVYGNPNSLTTTPALYLKWIRYFGADKGT